MNFLPRFGVDDFKVADECFAVRFCHRNGKGDDTVGGEEEASVAVALFGEIFKLFDDYLRGLLDGCEIGYGRKVGGGEEEGVHLLEV